MFLQDLQLRDTVKYSWTQFFDFVFLKVPVINFNNTKHIKFRATRDYHCSSVTHAGNTTQTIYVKGV